MIKDLRLFPQINLAPTSFYILFEPDNQTVFKFVDKKNVRVRRFVLNTGRKNSQILCFTDCCVFGILTLFNRESGESPLPEMFFLLMCFPDRLTFSHRKTLTSPNTSLAGKLPHSLYHQRFFGSCNEMNICVNTASSSLAQLPVGVCENRPDLVFHLAPSVFSPPAQFWIGLC